ncbi:universal stress protein, partial [Streptococcus pneumoniae]|uniref:universal stress protein n=1 Tax=Streptococcus pneumoniae TaxID=1313 RepID=UPI001E34EA80
ECHPVVARAQSLASTSNAKLSLVHIIEPMAMAFGGDVPMDLSMLQQQQFDQARERMNGFADSYPGLAPENRHLAYGQPRQEVHRLAKEQRCDLIVVGSHGRHGLALLLGSTECHPVVARAQSLASTSNAKLSLVHIIEPMAMAF